MAQKRYNNVLYIAKVSVEEYLDNTSNKLKHKAYHLKGIKIETADGWSMDKATYLS